MSDTIHYKGYTIEDDGGHGYYKALDPQGHQIASGEGSYTMREAIDQHIFKVYQWYRNTSNLSPHIARAAGLLSNHDADRIIEAGGMPDYDAAAEIANLPERRLVLGGEYNTRFILREDAIAAATPRKG